MHDIQFILKPNVFQSTQTLISFPLKTHGPLLIKLTTPIAIRIFGSQSKILLALKFGRINILNGWTRVLLHVINLFGLLQRTLLLTFLSLVLIFLTKLKFIFLLFRRFLLLNMTIEENHVSLFNLIIILLFLFANS